MADVYDYDIFHPDDDSLEQVMAQVYTDLFNPTLEASAREAFQCLLHLFNTRLARTTNNLHATNKRYLYRIIIKYLAEGVAPRDLTIITFNQDLQAEKILSAIASTPRWHSISECVFCFPHCYQIPFQRVTSPTTERSELFGLDDEGRECVRLLKLHGSLNWYSVHGNRNVSTRRMFDPKRQLSLTRRRLITPDMTISKQEGRRQYTLPAVVPPISHKSAVLHNRIRDLWDLAEEALREANEIVVFGYSCPQLDFESANLLRRSQRNHDAKISVIDPDAGVLTRYVSLLSASCLHYYASAARFLRI